jgi:voltage-gated potassium channel
MENHYIICGAGRIGGVVVRVLKENMVPIMIIERDRDIANFLKREGLSVILGDALDVKNLERAGVKNAKWVIAALGNDVDNLFIVLKAQELNPKIKIAARVSEEESIQSFHRAGVDLIVLPEIIGGLHLAKAVLGLEKPKALQTVEEVKKK